MLHSKQILILMDLEIILQGQMEMHVLPYLEHPQPIEMGVSTQMVMVSLMLMVHGVSLREPMHFRPISASGLILITMDLEIT